jgi:hypothetical protein
MHRLLIAIAFSTACSATVRTAPPPAQPVGPPPAPPPVQPVATQPAPPPAQPMPPPPPQAHAAYSTALANLRHARALLERPAGAADVKWDENMAIREIDGAIKEARDARMDDGVPLTEHPPIDNKMVYRDRLREALKLLGESAKDLGEREDNAWAKKDRKMAVDHVRRAEKSVREAIGDRAADAAEAPPPPPPAAHPAFAAALGNLRHARALLERPAGSGDVKWDEKMAIGEIDAAIKEARDARMDDGVPLTEHPAIDNTMAYRDRLREAMKLLGDSAKDLGEREDNAWAKKDRKMAVDHVHRAEKSVREAISDRKADAEEKAEEKAEKKAAKGH